MRKNEISNETFELIKARIIKENLPVDRNFIDGSFWHNYSFSSRFYIQTFQTRDNRWNLCVYDNEQNECIRYNFPSFMIYELWKFLYSIWEQQEIVRIEESAAWNLYSSNLGLGNSKSDFIDFLQG